MHRRPLLQLLDQYEQTWVTGLLPYRSFDRKEEEATLSRFRDFVREYSACFENTLAVGHVTASALILNPEKTKVLLTLHRKLNRWLQLGGHCDGDPLVQQSAMREAQEESGASNFEFLPSENKLGLGVTTPALLDLDIHLIPAGKEPAHYHYDARFALICCEPETIKISEESLDLRWFEIEEALEITDERSMQRQFDKLSALRG